MNYLNYTSVYWYDAFFVDDYYSEYKVVVKARNYDYYDYSSSNYAFVNVKQGTDSFCSDIEIYSNSVSMNENTTEYVSFNVRNNSDDRFYIKGVSPVEYESFFGASNYYNDSSIAANSTGKVELKVVSSEVSSDKTGTATLRIQGEFAGGKYCNYSDIQKDFIVRVDDSQPAQSCGNIIINAYDESIQENSNNTFSFSVRNYTDTGFYVDGFDVFDSSSYFNSVENYKPAYIPANSSRDFSYRVTSNSVSYSQTEKININISGHYDNGNYCSALNKTINFTVQNSSSQEGYCSDIYINSRNLSLSENNTHNYSFSVENNSGQRFYLERALIDETSSAVDFSNFGFSSSIERNSQKNISFTARTFNVSSYTSVPAYFKVQGRFENGSTCTLNDLSKSFNVTINNSGSNNYCSEINVSTKTIRLSKGETSYPEFTIRNESDSRFYIDYVSVYDNSSAIDASATNYPSGINANSSSVIQARIKGNENTNTTGYIEIKGHYENGDNCYSADIGKKSFSVVVEGATQDNSCSDFSLTVPEMKNVVGKEQINLGINNPTGKTGKIRLSGTNLSVSPYEITIPANYNFNKTIDVELMNGTESYLVYNIELQGCNVQSKTTKIISSQQSFEVVEFPSSKTVSKEDSISFTIKNNSFESREFKVYLKELPEGWTANQKSIVIPAGTQRTASLELTAGTTGKYNVSLAVESNGKTTEKTIELNSEENISVSAEISSGILSQTQLTITINNSSEETISGNALIELPENWTMEGNPSFEVKPQAKKEIVFNLNTDGKNTDKKIPVTVQLDNGKELTTQAEPVSATPSTGLISLGSSALTAIGLLVLIIIVVMLLAKKQ